MRLTLLFTTFLCFIANTYAINAPLDITADEMSVMPEKNTATFSGNVKLIQKDITLTAEKIIIFSTNQNKEVKKVIASKNVVFKFKGGNAKGNRAEWSPSTNLLKLAGNVELTQQGNTLSGTDLTYDMNTGRAKLSSGNSGRVKATFGH